MKSIKTLMTISTLVTLVACGGGGGGSGNPSVSAEGAWVGTSANYTINTLVLENNEFWNIFGTMSGSYLSVYGFDQGTLNMSGNTFNGNLREYPNGYSSYAGSIAGNVVANTSITGTTTGPGGTASYVVMPFATTTYNYNTPASIADVQGNWTGTMSNGYSGTTTINASGSLAGSSAGCLFTGSVTPRPSGKNVFNVSITFGGSPCLLPGQSASGIAIVTGITNSTQKQLIVAVQDAGKQNGSMFFARR